VSARRRFVYAICTGRCGTVFVSELFRLNFPQATVHHERLGPLQIGVHSPDMSHFTVFNTLGNTPKVRDFWRDKLGQDDRANGGLFVETSHLLAKAGLVENVDLVCERGADVRFVFLKRNLFDTVWSFYNRFDFYNTGFTWMFALDPNYRNKIVDPTPLRRYGMLGSAIWYVLEVWTRGEYYKLLLQDHPAAGIQEAWIEDLGEPANAGAFLHAVTGEHPASVRMPERRNERTESFFDSAAEAKARAVVEKLDFDCRRMARRFYDAGYRLASPKS
jgi:hypothetical protein